MIGSDISVPATYLFGDTNGVVATTDVLLAAVNDAVREVSRETLLLNGTLASTGNAVRSGLELNTEEDLIVIKRVIYDTKPLALMAQEMIDRLFIYDSPDGEPQGYYTDGTLLRCFPKPTSGDTTVVTINYAKLHANLAALGDTILFPDSFRNDLINYTVMRLHERNEAWKAAEIFDTKFKNSMSSRKYESMSRDDTFHVVTPDVVDQDFTWGEYLT